MPDHKDYQSAMDKVAPSDAWKAATLSFSGSCGCGSVLLPSSPQAFRTSTS